MKKNILVVCSLLVLILKAHLLYAQPNGGWLMIKVFNNGEELKFCTGTSPGWESEKTDSLNTMSMRSYASFNHKRYKRCASLGCWVVFYGLRLEMDEVTDYKLILTSRSSNEKMIILFNDLSSEGSKIKIDFKPGIFKIDRGNLTEGSGDVTPADWESARIKRASRWYQRKLQRKLKKAEIRAK